MGFFWALSPKWEFFSKIRLRQFLPLRHPNLTRSFRKILRVVLEKNAFTYWHTDILTVVKSQDPFSPKGGGSNETLYKYRIHQLDINFFFIRESFVRITRPKLVKTKNKLRTSWDWKIQEQEIEATVIYIFFKYSFNLQNSELNTVEFIFCELIGCSIGVYNFLLLKSVFFLWIWYTQ